MLGLGDGFCWCRGPRVCLCLWSGSLKWRQHSLLRPLPFLFSRPTDYVPNWVTKTSVCAPRKTNSKFDGLPREEIVRPVEPDRGHKQLLNVAIRACRREWGWNGVEIAKIDQILIDVLHSFWILQARFAPRSFYFAVLEIDGTDIFIVVECGVDCFNTPCNEIN
jgi:hypothetical protein